MKLSILNAEPDGFSAQARQVLASLGHLHEESCTRTRLLELVSDYDVLIVRLGHQIDKEVLESSQNLKVVVTATTGLNHIDLEQAEQRQVDVLSLKGEREFLNSITATAELAWGLLLAALRQLPAAFDSVASGRWNRQNFIGHELRGKTLGIIGCGRLGSMVAEYGRAFKMNVLAHDTRPQSIPSHVQSTSLDELLASADIISLHLPYDQSTHAFLDQPKISKIKKGTILVNTARGEIIDEEVLVTALRSGALGGFATDVLSGETSGNPNWLQENLVWQYAREHSNVIISPHIGGATHESMRDTELFMAEKLRLFINNKEN